MRIDAVELIRVRLPFVSAFRSALGVERERDALLVHVLTSVGDGWGECAAQSRASYTGEDVDGAHSALREELAPLLLAGGALGGAETDAALSAVPGHRMAKAALEMAVLDAELRGAGQSLARFLGAARSEVECGIALGIAESLPALLDDVEHRLQEGYRRIKLKIEPGWDVEPVAAVRARFGAEMLLTVDANGAYTIAHARHLSRLDEHSLAMIEQPLDPGSLQRHAELARLIRTPVCLDEPIVSTETARQAIELGACSIINIKPGRVGGLIEAKRVHDLCRQRATPVWCGGMFDTGIGRAANLALAALPGFTLPADISPAGRHFDVELTSPPAQMRNGCIAVPASPGLGVDVDRAIVDSVAVRTELIFRR